MCVCHTHARTHAHTHTHTHTHTNQYQTKFLDDTQLFYSALPADFGTLTKQTEMCVKHVKAWMDSNKLKLNDDKTEALVVSTRSRTSVCYNEHLEIGGSLDSFSA